MAHLRVMINADFSASHPSNIVFEARFRMTLSDWVKIREIINKGKEGYWGPARDLMEAIDSMVSQAEQAFEPKEVA